MATKAHSEETDEKGTEECHPYPDGVGRRSCVEDVELGASPTTEEELGPPDGGWGWMVTVGAFIIMNLLPMLPPCFGILFSRFLLDLGTSSTTTGWIFSTFCFVWNISSLFSRPLTKEFGWRAIAFTGILMVSSSLMVSAFAPTAEFLFISFSILGGAGCGMVVCICFCIVPLYFDKRRGQANAIMMAGAGMGQITGPPLIEYLLNEYTFKGAALIMGAVLLHGCIGALLFHPISWHQRRRPKSRSPGEVSTGEPLLHSQAKDATGVGVRTISIESIGDAREYKQVDNRLPATAVRNRLLKGRNSITSFGSSALGISFASGIDHIDNNSTHEEAHSCRCIELLSRILRTALSDIGILRSPRPLCISLGFALCVNSYINFAMMVPFAMQANGYSLQDSAICISVSAVFNLMMRITASFLSDWRRFHVKYCYMAALAVISVSTFGNRKFVSVVHDLV